MIDQILVDGIKFTTLQIPTQNTSVLVISGNNGFLACGYINIDIANKCNDVCAIVSGVKTPNDMLKAKVKLVSEAARKAGVTEDMTGKDALLLMA